VNGNPGPDPDEAHPLTGEQLEEAAPRSFVRKTGSLDDGASIMSYTARTSDWPALTWPAP
ncbi:MAG: hypothetical protein ACXVHX_36410, partial [Solirubrobacteraceae bacterium]